MRLKLIIAYDGRPFLGWQSQPGGNTVQDVLQTAAAEIGGEDTPVHGSGRTDTGVHALGQVAHFDTPPGNRMRPEDWQRALNAHLPPAIRILECVEAPPDFHARFSARRKTYRYRIFTGEILPPLLHGLVWRRPPGLDTDLLGRACRIFVGTHDFRNFAANRRDGSEREPHLPEHTTRTIHEVSLDQPAPGRIDLEFHGDGFLYKMVRLLTGSAVRCAEHKAPLDRLEDLLVPGDAPCKSNHLAPAEGLYLAHVTYG